MNLNHTSITWKVIIPRTYWINDGGGGSGLPRNIGVKSMLRRISRLGLRLRAARASSQFRRTARGHKPLVKKLAINILAAEAFVAQNL